MDVRELARESGTEAGEMPADESASASRTSRGLRGGGAPRIHRACLAIVASASVVLAACTTVAIAVLPKDDLAHTAAAASCPYAEFDAFVAHFSRDVAFQKAATADPLRVSHYDAAAGPEPRKLVDEMPLEDVVWPVMPPLDTLDAQRLTHLVEPLADGGIEVQVRRPDTSNQQAYRFARSPCWTLQGVTDESI